jgi:cytochrome P450
MLFEFVFYLCLSCTLVISVIVYWMIIRPQKQLYDIFRAQGINGERFVPLIGQLPEIYRYRQNDMVMSFQEDLRRKYGTAYLFCFGPLIRLVITEPDLLADILSRTNGQNYSKPPIFTAVFTPIIGQRNLLVAEGNEHERARRMINPAFHHVNLRSMVSIISDQTGRAIDALFSALTYEQDQTMTVDLHTQFNTLTLSIIASCAFGSGYATTSDAKKIICQTFNEVLAATRKMLSTKVLESLPN